tara:strand:+ start:63 stop:599 length:537 start_codon:yes stop_codon:yes gene_type:complete
MRERPSSGGVMKKIIVKKSHCCLVFLTVLFFLATPVMATQKAELWLWKFNEFLSGKCGWCGDFVTFKEGENRSSLSDFSLYDQDGYYAVSLKGPSKSTITLFGTEDFTTKQGFLIIIKQDNKTVSIDDLEAFIPETWVKVEAQEGVSGAYSAYYHPYPSFKNYIRSGKWGHWWDNLSS